MIPSYGESISGSSRSAYTRLHEGDPELFVDWSTLQVREEYLLPAVLDDHPYRFVEFRRQSLGLQARRRLSRVRPVLRPDRGNRARVAEDTAFCIISLARLAVTGESVPIQPLRAPSLLWIETKHPAIIVLSSRETHSGIDRTRPFVTRSSIAYLASLTGSEFSINVPQPKNICASL